MARNRLQHRDGIKAVQQHTAGTAEHRGVDAHQHASDVVQRRHRQQHILTPDVGRVGRSGGLEQGIAQGQHRALGQAGGARGVGHQGHLVQVDVARGAWRLHLGYGQKIFGAGGCGRRGGLELQQLGRNIERRLRGQQVAIAHDEHMFQRGLGAHLVHHRQQHIGGNDDAGTQVVQLVAELVLLVQRTAGADDGADLLDAVMRHHVLRAVVHEQGHRLTRLHAQVQQPRGKGIAGLVDLAPGDDAAVPEVGGGIGAFPRMLTQVLVQGNLGMGFCLHGVTLRVIARHPGSGASCQDSRAG